MDEYLLQFFSQHRTSWGTGFARIMMDVGTSTAALAVGSVLALMLVVVLRAYRPAAAVTIALIVSTIAAALLKEVFDRDAVT